MTDIRFQRALRQLHPTVEPSQALTDKITALAANTDGLPRTPRHSFSWPVAVSASLAAATAITGAALFLAPRRTLAGTLHKVYSNMTHSQGTHFRIIFFPKSKDALTMEVWSRNGRWRQDTIVGQTRMTQITGDGHIWSYFPAQHRAAYQSAGGAVATVSPSAEKAQAQILADLNNKNAMNLGKEVLEGRSLQKIAIPAQVQRFFLTTSEPGRSVLWIDTAKMLPIRAEQQLSEKGQWVTVQQIDYDFEQPVSPSVFTIPAGTRIFDYKTIGAEVGRRFARPLAEKRFASRTIALRDVQVNEEGDVFVLYTDGSTKDKEKESVPSIVHDNIGTPYTGTAGAIDPYMYCTDTASNRGILVGKEAMRSVCVVPITPLTAPWKPRNISIEIHFVEQIGKKNFTRTAKFTVPVQKPQTKLLPTYGADLASLSLAGGDAAQFKQDREWGRRAYFYNARDWAGMIRSTDRSIREGILDVNMYLDRAEAYKNLGKPAEARKELDSAEAEDRVEFHHDEIKKMRWELQQ